MFKFLSLGLATVSTKPMKIIAVGDSITEGAMASDESTHSWPAQLQDILKDKDQYVVENYGVSGRTMMKNGDYPYWNEQKYQDALNSEPDKVLIMLGTNDAKTFQWNETEYVNDYIDMAKSFIELDSKPELYFMIPPPLYVNGAYSMNQTVINQRFPELIPSIANSKEFEDKPEIIDVFNIMGGVKLAHYEWLCDGQSCDGCHPNDAGYTALASGIYKDLFNPVPPTVVGEYEIENLQELSFL